MQLFTCVAASSQTVGLRSSSNLGKNMWAKPAPAPLRVRPRNNFTNNLLKLIYSKLENYFVF